MGSTKSATGGGGGASTTNSGGGGARKMTGGGGGGANANTGSSKTRTGRRRETISSGGRRRRAKGKAGDARGRAGGGKKGQPAVCIGGVRPLRITPQIRPIGGRRVDDAGPPPRDRLAPGGDDGAHACRHEVVGISGEEFRIAIQRVALQRRGVGFLRGEIANRPRADRCRLFVRNGGRRRIGRPLRENQPGLHL